MISGKSGLDIGGSLTLTEACHNCVIACLNVLFSSILADYLVVVSIEVSTGITTVSVLVVIDSLTLDLVKSGCLASLPQTNHKNLTIVK